MKNFIYDPKKRFLTLDVFHSNYKGMGRTHDGMNTIYIPCEEGPVFYEDIDDDDKIFETERRSENYWAVTPIRKPSGTMGPMAGGNLAYSSDSRCKYVYHIHDRFETPEAYKTLST